MTMIDFLGRPLRLGGAEVDGVDSLRRLFAAEFDLLLAGFFVVFAGALPRFGCDGLEPGRAMTVFLSSARSAGVP